MCLFSTIALVPGAFILYGMNTVYVYKSVYQHSYNIFTKKCCIEVEDMCRKCLFSFIQSICFAEKVGIFLTSDKKC